MCTEEQKQNRKKYWILIVLFFFLSDLNEKTKKNTLNWKKNPQFIIVFKRFDINRIWTRQDSAAWLDLLKFGWSFFHWNFVSTLKFETHLIERNGFIFAGNQKLLWHNKDKTLLVLFFSNKWRDFRSMLDRSISTLVSILFCSFLLSAFFPSHLLQRNT